MSKRPKVEIDTSAQAAALQAQTAAVQEQTKAQTAQSDTANKALEAQRVAAENANAMLRQQQEQARIEAANASTLKSNMGQDLKAENIAQVVAGGSADAAAGTPSSTLKKKRLGGTLSSQLGVNV